MPHFFIKRINSNMEEDTDIIKTDDEIEEEVQAAAIETPFNPYLIKIKRDPFTLGQLIDKIRYKEVNFDTAFQRQRDLWDAEKQSRLIESVLLNLPLPAFYFDETDSVNQLWNVIDGLQRCSAFDNYIVKETLTLQNLEFLHDYEVPYAKLPRELRRRIEQTPLTVFVVEKGTPDEVKFNIFKRINTGGLILTPQEIRHAMNQGIPAQYVQELAEMESFKKATCYKIKSDRMEDRDFVTRYISFYLLGYKNYQPDLDGFMTKGMAAIKDCTIVQRDTMKAAFDKAMGFAYAIFDNDAFRKREDKYAYRRPINKPLFEVISVLFAQMNKDLLSLLKERKETFKEKFISLNQDRGFQYAISSGTGQKASVTKRFEEMDRIIQETIKQ